MNRKRYEHNNRRTALETAINAVLLKEGPAGVRAQLSSTLARVQTMVVEIDEDGAVVHPALWLKWLSMDSESLAEYNKNRKSFTSDRILDPSIIGPVVPSDHPAYHAVENYYAQFGLFFNKNFKLIFLPKRAPEPTIGFQDAQWNDITAHILGLINALPAAQRAVVIGKLLASFSRQ